MSKRPPVPEDFDENPPLDQDFWAQARPAREDTELMRIIYGDDNGLRLALEAIVAAHDAGEPVGPAIERARALISAGES